jgi:hypothetical protein
VIVVLGLVTSRPGRPASFLTVAASKVWTAPVRLVSSQAWVVVSVSSTRPSACSPNAVRSRPCGSLPVTSTLPGSGAPARVAYATGATTSAPAGRTSTRSLVCASR